jgi:hypothetical protein
VRLDEVIRNFRGFAILSNSNDCIWITIFLLNVCLDREIGNFVVNILDLYFKFEKFWIKFKIWKTRINLQILKKKVNLQF